MTAFCLAAACRQPAVTAKGQEAGSAGPDGSAYDADTTDIARVLAGLPPGRRQAFAGLTGLPGWHDWESEARDRWAGAWNQRFGPVRAWADSALKHVSGDCQTLLHPSGGTSFLTTYLLFPRCDAYILIGPEPAGQLPTFDAVTPAQLVGLADEVRRGFPEVFAQDRALTRRAGAAPGGHRRPGALSPLLVQLARLDARIVSASRFDIATDGRPLESIPIRGGNGRPVALSIAFEVPKGRPQSLVYLPADLDDAALGRRPGIWTFLRLQAPFFTLLAPSSGLQGGRFTLLRQLILEQSRVILQDQPAMPPRVLDPGAWNISTLTTPPAAAFSRVATPTLAVRRKSAAPAKRR